MTELRITEIFYSLQGEAATSGRPTVFVRLTGCPLRCTYCDSAYAFHGGSRHSIESILDQVASYPTRLVCVTGGEPLAQPDCVDLLHALCDRGHEVSLETSGALSTEAVDTRVSVVLDLKTPGSGEVSRNLWDNIDRLQRRDQVKFVLRDRADYEWARFKLDEHQLHRRVDHIWLSPVHEVLNPADLADWMLKDGVPARLQLQIHKLLWGDKPGV